MQRWAGAWLAPVRWQGSLPGHRLQSFCYLLPTMWLCSSKILPYHQVNHFYYKTMKLHSFLFMKSEPIRASSFYKKARVPIFNI